MGSITNQQRRVQYKRLKFLKSSHFLQTKESKSRIGGNSDFLSVVFENSQVPMCIIRVMDLTIVDANNRFLGLMGLKPSEIIGKKMTKANLFSELIDFLNQTYLGFPIFGEEIEFRSKGRENKSGLISVSTITFESESYYVVQIQDITDSRQTLTKLKKQKDLLEKIANERTIELIKSSRRISSILECIDSPFLIVDND
ncbi:MAG: PAS domain S-box protein, partial [Candidatus Saccharibacteria bacterium]